MAKYKEVYFCISATTSEHDVLQGLLTTYCNMHELDLMYYRKFKDGHRPMYREVKVQGKISRLIPWLKENGVTPLKRSTRNLTIEPMYHDMEFPVQESNKL